jgi:hypothetical protein
MARNEPSGRGDSELAQLMQFFFLTAAPRLEGHRGWRGTEDDSKVTNVECRTRNFE